MQMASSRRAFYRLVDPSRLADPLLSSLSSCWPVSHGSNPIF